MEENVLASSQKSVLVIGTQLDRLTMSSTFLNRRGWASEVIVSFREALVHLVEKRPRFVFLSIQLNPKHLSAYRRLIRRTPGTHEILFSEVANFESVIRLGELKGQNHLRPPVGGPAFDRALRKIRLKSQSESGTEESSEIEAGEVYWPYGSNPRINLSRPSAKSLSEALTKSICEITGGVPKTPGECGELVTHLSCVEIKSTGLCGYLVAARGNNQPFEAKLLEKVYQRVSTLLREKGEVLAQSQVYVTKVEPVDFKAWSDEQAEFSRSVVVEGEEIHFSYFTETEGEGFGQPIREFGPMMAIDLDSLPTDTNLQFDLYLYLPLNNRFVRYIHRGNPVDAASRARLGSKSIGELFFRRVDLPRWHNFRLARKLGERVRQYNLSQSQLTRMA